MTQFRRGGRIIRVGHRGAAALAPENTLRSFERAIELGVDFVEFDVFDLSDGTLVLAHSDDLHEVSHGAAVGHVRRLSLGRLREVAPDVPTLEQALDFFRSRDVGLHVDVKCRRHGAAVAAALRRHAVHDRSIVSSFWRSTLREVRRTDPELQVALTYPDDRYGLTRRRPLAPLVPPTVKLLRRALPLRLKRWLDSVEPEVVMLHYAVLSAAAVASCHVRDVPVWAWTVNDTELLERVVQLGVDGVISDDPRVFGEEARLD